MPEERIITVQGVTKGTNKNGKAFLCVEDTNNDKFWLYCKPKDWGLITEGVVLRLAGEQNGDYYNVSGFNLDLPGSAPVAPKPHPQVGGTFVTPIENNTAMTKDDWEAKENRKSQAIDGNTAFQSGVELLCAHITAGKDIPDKTTKVGKFIYAAVNWGLERLDLTQAIIAKVEEIKKEGQDELFG